MENSLWHYDYVRLAWDSGFCFDKQKAKSTLDWSSLGLIDVEKVISDRDIAVIEKCIPTVLDFKLDEDLTRILEPNFVKIFRLTQLALQYLIFCKKYLDNTVALLKKELAKSKEILNKAARKEEDNEKEVAALKRKVKELKAALEYHPVYPENTFRCPECPKVFASEDFLDAHLARRHNILRNDLLRNDPLRNDRVRNDPSRNEPMSLFQTETVKLQMEIKQLKEQLNSTEKYSQPVEKSKENKIIACDRLITNKDNNTDDNTNNHCNLSKDSKSKSNEVSTSEHSTRVKDLQEKFDKLKEHVEKELKSINDQKWHVEKYEKWMEMAFLRLDNTQKEQFESQEKSMKGKDLNNVEKVDSFTQTKKGEIQKDNEVEESYDENAQLKLIQLPKNIMGDYDLMEQQKSNIEMHLKEIFKLQQEIKVDTNYQIEHFEEVVQEKVAKSLNRLQTQMQSFWTKLNEIQDRKNSDTQDKIALDVVLPSPRLGDSREMQDQKQTQDQRPTQYERQTPFPRQIHSSPAPTHRTSIHKSPIRATTNRGSPTERTPIRRSPIRESPVHTSSAHASPRYKSAQQRSPPYGSPNRMYGSFVQPHTSNRMYASPNQTHTYSHKAHTRPTKSHSSPTRSHTPSDRINNATLYTKHESDDSSNDSLSSPKTKPKPMPRSTHSKSPQSIAINRSTDIHQSSNNKSLGITKSPTTAKNKKSASDYIKNRGRTSFFSSTKKPTSPVRKPIQVSNPFKQGKGIEESTVKEIPRKGITKEVETEESESAETSDEDDSSSPKLKTVGKPSNTSTLGKHSITSLKQAVLDEDVTYGLRQEVQNVVEQRLEEVGVSSEWNGLPDKSFKRALKIIKHQGSMASKSFGEYTDIREQILQEVESRASLKLSNLDRKSRKDVVAKSKSVEFHTQKEKRKHRGPSPKSEGHPSRTVGHPSNYGVVNQDTMAFVSKLKQKPTFQPQILARKQLKTEGTPTKIITTKLAATKPITTNPVTTKPVTTIPVTTKAAKNAHEHPQNVPVRRQSVPQDPDNVPKNFQRKPSKSMYASSDDVSSIQEEIVGPKQLTSPNQIISLEQITSSKIQIPKQIENLKQMENLISELKQVVGKHKEETSSSEELEVHPTQSKGLLKSANASATTLNKKKVLFDLESSLSNNNDMPNVEKRAENLQEKNQNNFQEKENFQQKFDNVKDGDKQRPEKEQSEKNVINKKPIYIRTGGSDSTSIGSSVLELDAARARPKVGAVGDTPAPPKKVPVKADDASDWDLSDVLSYTK